MPLNYGIPAMSDLAPGSVDDVSGIELAHATHESALAGCTVVAAEDAGGLPAACSFPPGQ